MTKRVLIAEDDLAWQKFFRDFFEPFGWECVVVSDWTGLYSVLTARAHNEFKGLVLDLGLGVDAVLGMDELLDLSQTFEISIVVTTASPNVDATLAKRCLKLPQVRQFIHKSKIFERLGDLVREFQIDVDESLVLTAQSYNSLSVFRKVARDMENDCGKKVFVVHGQDGKVRSGVFEFLRAIGLQPLEWGHAVELSGDPAPYVKQVLERAMAECAAVLVLLTPDEVVNLRKELRAPHTNPNDIRRLNQARPNVFLELGLALATSPGKIVVAEIGESKIPSDIDGLHRVRLDNSPEQRNELAQRLSACGCDVDTRGSDWVKSGDLSIS